MKDSLLLEQAAALTSMLPRLVRLLFTIDVNDPAVDLPVAQIRVCSILSDAPHSISALSKELGISLSATTQVADRLERAGLVTRVAEASDRRVKMLELTPRGSGLMRIRKEIRTRRAYDALTHLPAESREGVLEALQMLLDASAASAPPIPDGALVPEQSDV